MSKYTPGPWVVNIDSDIDQIVIDSNDHSICTIDSPAHIAMDNANLIACAPEMLEALKALVNSPTMGWLNHAKELIKKAEGGNP